ncbi:MAG: DUF1223 domain-containing protein [Pseudomonadota bacterium]
MRGRGAGRIGKLRRMAAKRDGEGAAVRLMFAGKMLTFAGAFAVLLAGFAASAADRPRAFLELFTSQGCSSCPAADALLGSLENEDGVYAVTMPVKLWDFLGWTDTLATDTATKRQMAYSVSRGDRDVFTPQMVVNGRKSVLGSDRDEIEETVSRFASEPLPLPIDLSVSGGILTIDVGAADIDIQQAELWLLIVDESTDVPVKGGENRGRKLTYHNVVREMRPVGMWKGKPLRFDLPLSDVEKAPNAGCYVIAQVETFRGPGEVIGAAKLDRLFPARTVKAQR